MGMEGEGQYMRSSPRSPSSNAAAALAAGFPMMLPHGMPGPPPPALPLVPPGLQALYDACKRVYPEQANPLQVASVVKYWLGGPDPLDFISMYENRGDPANDIPPHWHYVSFGLSDLHGDGRVHQMSGPDTPSGYGFELTFRLRKDPEELGPPTWPAAVMQALAKYVFQTDNVLCAGDHVSWNCSLDASESRIQHMLIIQDPQLDTVMSPFGNVTFLQIVGVCQEELQAAQQWNVSGVLGMMKMISEARAGGPWLITDMRRGESIFELDPTVRALVDDGISAEGSNLSGVSAKCSWTEELPEETGSTSNSDKSDSESGNISKNLVKEDSKPPRGTFSPSIPLSPTVRNSSAMSVSHENDPTSRMSYASETGRPQHIDEFELSAPKHMSNLHLKLNFEAGSVLPLAIRGRLKHGRHFTFKSVNGDLAVTFVTPSVSGAYATIEHPYAIHGPWLQILIPNEFLEEMYEDLQDIPNLDLVDLPKTYLWSQQKLAITLLPEEL